MTTDTGTRRRSRTEKDPALEPPWHVILLDDSDHTYEYVIHMLGSIFGYGPEKSFTLASIVDSEGRVIVITTSHEKALAYQSKIHAFGPDPRIPHCKGSMSAVLEPAE